MSEMELARQLQSIHDTVVLIKDRQVTALECLNKHEKAIYGNGEPGLKTQLALITQKVALIALLGGSGAGLVVTVLLAIFKVK